MRSCHSFVDLDNNDLDDWTDVGVGRHPGHPDQESRRNGPCRSYRCAFCWDLGLLGVVPLGKDRKVPLGSDAVLSYRLFSVLQNHMRSSDTSW